jgi:glycerol uptake facilitator-like aquaporin
MEENHRVMMKKLAAELFGTFALVFAGTGAIVINDGSTGAISHVGVALTFGLVVWIYLAAPVLGSLLAVLGCRCDQEHGCCTTLATKSCENL